MCHKYYYLIPFLLLAILYPKITGNVKNQLNQKPIEGVNIIVDDKGTVSDKNGNFTIEAPFKTDIHFAHIGFKKISLNSKEIMNVYLEPSVIQSTEIYVLAGLIKKNKMQEGKSITVLTRDELRKSSANHLQTLVDQVPNINWAGGTSRPRYFQIRGIGERSHFFGEGPPNFSVGFVLDDMDLSGLGMIGHLFDQNQIEIFKGPQSTIFGSNALAGLISIKSVDPIEGFAFKSSLSIGTDNLKNISSALNFNLIENLNIRVSSTFNYSDGFRNNISRGINNSNKKEELFTRVKAHFKPSLNFNILGTIIYANLKNGYDAWAPDNNNDFKTFSDSTGEDSQKTTGFSVRSELKVSEDFRLTAISTHTITDQVHSYDGDWGDSLYWASNYGWDDNIQGYAYSFYDENVRKRISSSNELRFHYSNLVLGGYYRILKENDEALGYLYGGSGTNGISNYENEVYALYSQFEYELLKNFFLETNIRFENSSYNYLGKTKGTNYYYEPINLPDISFDSEDLMTGYRFLLKYDSNSSVSYFSSISKGFKAGGVNQQPGLATINRPYNPEYLINYEFGFKLNARKLTSEFTAFYGKREKQQVSISTQQEEGNPNSFLFYTDNAASGRTSGFELENTLNISDELEIIFSLGYLDTYVNKFKYQIDNNSIKIGGGREASSSPNTASIGGNYSSKSGLFLNIRTNLKGVYYYSDSHDQQSKAYSISNVSLGKLFENIRFSFWVHNIFDKGYVTRGFYFGLIPPDYPEQLFESYGDPRHLGLKVDYNF